MEERYVKALFTKLPNHPVTEEARRYTMNHIYPPTLTDRLREKIRKKTKKLP